MMKNPWGKETYNGDWSKGDKRWKEFAKQAPINPLQQDGMIFVDADTFTRAFYTYHVGHYIPEYVRHHFDFDNDDGS